MLRNNLPLFTENNLSRYVPIEILRENAEQVGGFSKNNLVGEGPFFKYKPFSKFSKEQGASYLEKLPSMLLLSETKQQRISLK